MYSEGILLGKKEMSEGRGRCGSWMFPVASRNGCFELPRRTCKNSDRLMGSIHLIFQKLGVANIHFLRDNIQSLYV